MVYSIMFPECNRPIFISVPDNLKQSKELRSPTTKSETYINVHGRGSEVKVYTSDKGGSSTSLRSSVASEFDLRNSIAAFTESKVDEFKEQVSFEHKRFKVAIEKLADNDLLIIVADEGSGAKDLSFQVLSVNDTEQIFIASNIEESISCIRNSGPTLILHVNPFGLFEINTSAVDKLMNMIALSQTSQKRTLKNIITVKRWIWEKCKHRLGRYHACVIDLEDKDLQLTENDRHGLVNVLIHNNKEIWTERVRNEGLTKESANDLLFEIGKQSWSIGFPKRFLDFIKSRENFRKGCDYFTSPVKEVCSLFQMFASTVKIVDVMNKCLVLVLEIVLEGNFAEENITRIAHEIVRQKRHGKKKRQTYRQGAIQKVETQPWNEVIQYYANNCIESLNDHVADGLSVLEDRMLKQIRPKIYHFSAPCIRNSVLLSISKKFPKYVLEICDLEFFKEYVAGNTSGRKKLEENYVKLHTSDTLICDIAIRKLMELLEKGNTEAFAKHKLMSDMTFVEYFMRSFNGDQDLFWSTFTKSDPGNDRCVIEISLECIDSTGTDGIANHNLAYKVVLHRFWEQKRKCNKEKARSVELHFLRHVCSIGDNETYFKLQSKYDVFPDLECLLAAVEGKSTRIVSDILARENSSIKAKGKRKAMELALRLYTDDPINSRRNVVRELLHYVDINDNGGVGTEPFICTAAKSGDARMIVTLQQFKGNINLTNGTGRTCLHEAVRHRQNAFIETALKYGADQRLCDRTSGYMPIHEATLNDDVEVMNLLAEADNSILEAFDAKMRQPVHLAAEHNKVEAMKFLLGRNVQIRYVDSRRPTPLNLAGNCDVQYLLLEAMSKTSNSTRQNVAVANDYQATECLFRAVSENKKDMVIFLLNNGFNVNCTNKRNYSLLHFAIKANPGIVQLLLNYDIDVDRACDGLYPVHVATQCKLLDILRELTDARANLGARTLKGGDTVLHIATRAGSEDLVYFILKEATYLLHETNRDGDLPLHEAVRISNLRLVRTFLAYGADTARINRVNLTPLNIAELFLNDPNPLKDMFDIAYVLKRSGAYCLETAL
ncbi:hypothetical protein ACF0H5_022133 [Mactra antiquata]